jgi:geranylgeranyl pyrophosphate synthase
VDEVGVAGPHAVAQLEDGGHASERYTSRDAMEARILELTERAIESLASVELAEPAAAELEALAVYIASREV